MTIYVETKTNLLWEVQLFEDFALVRLATPGYERSLKQIPLEEFGRDFDECWADTRYLKKEPNDIKEKAPKGA